MQKVRFIISALIMVAGLTYPAMYAFASNLHLILGADFINSDVKYNKNDDPNEIKDDFKSVSPVIGLSAYGIGLEAFILNSGKIEENSAEAKLKAYGIAVTGEANLSDNFSFIASLGLAEYKFNVKKNNVKFDEDANGPRIGVGLQYYLTRYLAIRGMYHYTILNSGENDTYDAISEFTAGLRLIF